MKPALIAALLLVPFAALADTGGKDPFTKGDAAAGQTKAAACGACHGPTGNSATPEWPKLAGQSSKYIVAQLKAFKAGERKNAVMAPQAAMLSDADMADIAAHYAAQKASPGLASKDSIAVAQKLYRAGDATRGIPACSACHGPTGAGNSGAGYPRLGGQHSVYLINSFRELREAATQTLPDGNRKIMATIAAKLTDAEIAALSSYANGLQ